MNILESPLITRVERLCADAYRRNFHERNGGNISYRLSDSDVASLKSGFVPSRTYPTGVTVKDLADEYFLVTATGKFLGNVPYEPESGLGIIQISHDGTEYTIMWGFADGGKPTSELPTHLLNHQVGKRKSNGKIRIVYHLHPTNLIALTYILPLEDEVFSRQLFESSVECAVVFPEGLGVLPYDVPGCVNIGEKTSHKMEKYNAVVWSFHGLFVMGETFDSTYGLADTIEKAASILIKVLSVNPDYLHKKNTISKDQLICLADAFHVTINKDILK